MLYLRYGKTAKQMNMHIIPCLHTSCRICIYVYTTNHQINLEKQINGYQRCIAFDPDASRLDTCRVKVQKTSTDYYTIQTYHSFTQTIKGDSRDPLLYGKLTIRESPLLGVPENPIETRFPSKYIIAVLG